MASERFRILKRYLTEYWDNGENANIDPKEYPGHEFFVEIEEDGLHKFMVLTENEAREEFRTWVDHRAYFDGIKWFLEPFYESDDDTAEEFEKELIYCITDDYMEELSKQHNFSLDAVTKDELEKIFGSIPSLIQKALQDEGIDYYSFYSTIEDYYSLGYGVDSVDFEYGQYGEYFIFEIE